MMSTISVELQSMSELFWSYLNKIEKLGQIESKMMIQIKSICFSYIGLIFAVCVEFNMITESN